MSLTGTSDAQDLAAFARGDSSAFERLVAAHGGMVYHACLRVLGRADLAEDAAQATFLILARTAGAVRGSLGGWLHGVARNVALRARQAESARQAREKEAAKMAARRRVETPEAGWHEIRPRLDEAVAQLPAGERDAVVLHYLEGRPRSSVAEALGVPEGTVASRLDRAVGRMRRFLAGREVAIGSAALGGLLAAEAAAQVAPASLVATLNGLGAGSAAVQASPAAVALADGAMKAMVTVKIKLAVAAIAAVAAIGAAVPVTAAAIRTAERAGQPESAALPPGPLAGRPSKPGAHLEKVKALGDNAWINLGRPAPDPKFGAAQGRSWSRKMAYAPDLRGAFLYGSGVHHGMSMRGGRKYFNDDLYFYDINAHAWVCCHPGTPLTADGKIDPEIKVDPATGLNVDRDGKVIPVATSVHAYWTPEYDTDLKMFMFVPSTDPFGFLSYDQKTQKYSTPPNYCSPWDGGRYSPYYYDGRTGKFERRKAASPGTGPNFDTGVFYSPRLKKAVYLRDGVWLYDHAANTWKRANADGGNGPAACYDSKRDQVCTIAVDRAAGGKNRLEVFDLASGKWSRPEVKGDIGAWLDSNDCFFAYDSANDVALLHVKGKHHAYDPNARTWTAMPVTVRQSPDWVSGSGFYDPETNAHFYFNAGDSSTDPGNMWAYRYASGGAGKKE